MKKRAVAVTIASSITVSWSRALMPTFSARRDRLSIGVSTIDGAESQRKGAVIFMIRMQKEHLRIILRAEKRDLLDQ
jgi:hypothetical protein